MIEMENNIRLYAMQLMDAYDNWLDAEYEEEYDDARKEYNRSLLRLSKLTGVSQYTLASALGNQDGCTYNLDWLRALGVEI